MKKHILILLIIAGCSDDETRNEKRFYSNGQLKSKAQFRNGIPDGGYVEYDSLGNLIIESNYDSGQLDGNFKQYYEDGKLAIETKFKMGKRDGEFIHYHRTGSVWEHMVYDDDEVLVRKVYDEAGDITSYFNCVLVNSRVQNDTIKLEASFQKQPDDSFSSGAILYVENNNRKIDTLAFSAENTNSVEISFPLSFLDSYPNLKVDFLEIVDVYIESTITIPKIEPEYVNEKVCALWER